MLINLRQVGTEFIIEGSTSSVVTVNGVTKKFLNYDSSILTSDSSQTTASNNLFDYTLDNLKDIYDFKNNTIIFGGNSNNITGLFDLTKNNVTIKNLNIKVTNKTDAYDSIQGYLIINRLQSNTVTNTTIENCHIFFDLSTDFASGTAGLIGDYFKNGSVSNCSMDFIGTITPGLKNNKGWICGSYCGYSENNETSAVTITDCYSTGTISGDYAGGICGEFCGHATGTNSSSTVEITNCYSTGNIGEDFSGGICGSLCGYSKGNNSSSTVNINNCYSIGTIGTNSGGICGLFCGKYENGGNSTVTINNCYSIGTINGTNSGGICGPACGDDASGGGGTSKVTIQCCYTLNGDVPFKEGDEYYGSGYLVGIFPNINSIILTNKINSFSTLSSDEATTTSRSPLSTLLSTCDGYSEYRTVFTTGEAPILDAFLVCEDWKIDLSNLEFFAPELGFCGCPVDGIWQQTSPDTTVTIGCESRTCNAQGVWENVDFSKCKKDLTSVVILVSILVPICLIILFLFILV